MPIELSPEQAKVIGAVLRTADHYCSECAADLAAEMEKVCPGHDWAALVDLSSGAERCDAS
jgi:hypothetical protein